MSFWCISSWSRGWTDRIDLYNSISGCPAGVYLVGAGVGRIGLIDHDTISGCPAGVYLAGAGVGRIGLINIILFQGVLLVYI